MKLKRLCALACCLALMVCMIPVHASALDAGVYTASVVTSYYNPDTGQVDDGGTANAELGEGMCRSATGTTGLVEVDRNGNTWVTIRLLLASNCKNAAFYTRTGYNKYSRVSHQITSENSANDSIDYRFKVPSSGTKLKATMYVTPMGRDVLWYLNINPSSLKAGHGDFVVSIDTAPAPATPAKKPAAENTVKKADTKADVKNTDKDKAEDSKVDEEKDKDKDSVSEKDAEKDNEPAENKDTEKDNGKDINDSDTDKDSAEKDAEAGEDSGAGMGIGIAAIGIAAIAAIVFYFVKRKK